jgi:Domain of unknown function (DUF4345)
MSRRALQVVLAILALVPFSGGLATVVLGADRFAGGAPVPAEVDHSLRYLSGFYLGIALLIWCVVPRIERHGLLVVALTGCIFLGGVARLVSVLDVGAAGPLQYGLIAFELALPALILWQRQVARAMPQARPAPTPTR